jgi:type VI secretion system protein ImpH
VASPSRAKTDSVENSPLLDQLKQEPWTFDFFQAIRLIASFLPGRAAIGKFAQPEEELVRLGVHPSLSFPASQIQSLTWPQGEQPSMRVNFMGLIGALGVLPAYYTEMVAERSRSRDATLRDFLDLFHHRIVSLFYQAWEKTRFGIAYERSGENQFHEVLLNLAGLGARPLRNRQTVRDEIFVYYAALYGMATRPAAALEAILSDYFEVDIEIDQFIGVWRALDVPDQCLFETGDPQSYQLGWGAVAGDELWDRQSRARIKIGPLTERQYLDFLPTGTAYEPLCALCKAFSGTDVEFEVQLILRRNEVKSCELGDESEAGPQLGWFTWMKSKKSFDRDPGDTVLLLA